MRPPGHGDLMVAARVLRMHPVARRRFVLARLLAEAEVADRWGRARGRPHPRLGDGSLMTAALRRGATPAFSPSDPDYCQCLSMVAEAVAGEA